MKRFLSILLATGLATTALAGNSDRYHDNKFDSAVGHAETADLTAATTPGVSATFSTRNAKKSGGSYAYSNPYGVGPNNDSR